MTPTVALVTSSYRGDLERCRLLCDSIDRFVTGHRRHYLLVEAADVEAERFALPATRFAVNAYLTFVEKRSLLEAIASSLTEMFSPQVIGERVSAILQRYPYIDADTLGYFTPRLTQAPRDVDLALSYVREHAVTRETQQAVVDALVTKCDILWAMLDALHFAYVEPAHVSPGAFVPQDHVRS